MITTRFCWRKVFVEDYLSINFYLLTLLVSERTIVAILFNLKIAKAAEAIIIPVMFVVVHVMEVGNQGH